MDVLKKFATRGGGVVKECQWKFVVSRREDISEMEGLLTRLNTQLSEKSRIDEKDVLVMPEGIEERELAERGKWVAEICKAKGWRYCPRVHVALFGNVRGT
jgi:7-carboxy-7-deazaguanine synthase